MVPQMARLAFVHGLGFFAIDEIQNLNEASSGGARQMLNFFVMLANVVGVPTVIIGTYGAVPILSAQFREARRCSGLGEMPWPRMNDTEGDFLLSRIWKYQYLRNPVPLTEAFKQLFRDETWGIHDLVVKYYILGQARALAHGDERLAPTHVISAAQDCLPMVRDKLKKARHLMATIQKPEGNQPPLEGSAGNDQAARTTSGAMAVRVGR